MTILSISPRKVFPTYPFTQLSEQHRGRRGHDYSTDENNENPEEGSLATPGPGVLAGNRPVTGPGAMPLTPLLHSAVFKDG